MLEPQYKCTDFIYADKDCTYKGYKVGEYGNIL